jgi:hypothetical protein
MKRLHGQARDKFLFCNVVLRKKKTPKEVGVFCFCAAQLKTLCFGFGQRVWAGAVCDGAVVLVPMEPMADGALVLDDPEPVVERLPEPVVERVVVLTPTRARTPLSLVMTRLRLTPRSPIA